jgi:hypothetical protein
LLQARIAGAIEATVRDSAYGVATDVRISQSSESYVPAVVVPVHVAASVHWLETLEQCFVEQSVSVVQGHAPPADVTFT